MSDDLISRDALIKHLNTTMYRDVMEEIKKFPATTPEKALMNKSNAENEIRNPLVFDGCFTCYDRETCPDAFFGKARICNNYGKCEQG